MLRAHPSSQATIVDGCAAVLQRTKSRAGEGSQGREEFIEPPIRPCRALSPAMTFTPTVSAKARNGPHVVAFITQFFRHCSPQGWT